MTFTLDWASSSGSRRLTFQSLIITDNRPLNFQLKREITDDNVLIEGSFYHPHHIIVLLLLKHHSKIDSFEKKGCLLP
jgi:hypothetical protein